jgi:PAS domain S-box-containing protein
VIKVSQAVSGEIVLEKLIDTLMRTAIEQAGAERDLLILPCGGEQRIAAEATTNGETITVQQRDVPVTAAVLPDSVLHYVLHTRESVMLDDAAAQSQFATDSYIVQYRARSILCLPLTNQAKLIGALYLENNLTTRAFTPTRIAVLKFIASQAAISLENTQLYRDLEQREAKIRRLVDANIIGIVIWDIEGPILEANDAFLRMIGYDRDDLVSGRLRWTDLTPPEWHNSDTQRWVPEIMRTGRLQPIEKEYFRKDGSRVPVLIGTAGFEEGTNPGIGFVLDLTERKCAEVALRRSETYLAEAQRLTRTGSWAIDPVREQLLHCSEELFRIYGVDLQNGPPPIELLLERVHPEDRDRVRELRIKGGGVRDKVESAIDYRLLLPDGTIKYIHSIRHPVLNETGEILEFLGASMDVTEQKRAEEELRTAETRFRTYVDHATDALFVQDENGKIIDMNRQASLSLGYTREELIGNLPSLFDRGVDEALVHRMVERLESGELVELESIHQRKDGTMFPVELRVRPFRHSEQRFSLCLARDITDRKRAEQEREKLHQLEADLTRVSRVSMMGELAASLAHEMKQPIAAAVSNADACLQWLAHTPPDLVEVREAATEMAKEAKRAADVIDRNRALYRRDTLEREKVDLNKLIREIVVLLRDAAGRQAIAIRADLDGALPTITADRVQLQQVLMNLMLNGIEAMKDTGGELTIRSKTTKDRQILLSVSDAGIGFPPEHTERIFDAFFTTKDQGTGMGLSISRRIIESHAGRLWASANTGRGATFHFTLPVDPTPSFPSVN